MCVVKVKIQNRAEICTSWKESETEGEQLRQQQQAFTIQEPSVIRGASVLPKGLPTLIWVESDL